MYFLLNLQKLGRLGLACVATASIPNGGKTTMAKLEFVGVDIASIKSPKECTLAWQFSLHCSSFISMALRSQLEAGAKIGQWANT